MTSLRSLFFVYCYSFSVFIMALIVSGCDTQEPTHSTVSDKSKVRVFTGKWTATGNRQTMTFGPGHEAITFRLTGSMLLSGKDRPRKGFKADVLGFTDSMKGLQGRSVWTDEHGDQIFSEVHSESGNADRLIEGKFLGGTGRYAIANGEYTFKWQHLVNSENGQISGRTVDLKGWVQLGGIDTAPTSVGGQQ